MSDNQKKALTPRGAFAGLAAGIVFFCFLGFINPPNAWLQWTCIAIGTLFVWSGIASFFRLGGGWFVWGVVAVLTLGLGSAGVIAMNLLTAVK